MRDTAGSHHVSNITAIMLAETTQTPSHLGIPFSRAQSHDRGRVPILINPSLWKQDHGVPGEPVSTISEMTRAFHTQPRSASAVIRPE